MVLCTVGCDGHHSASGFTVRERLTQLCALVHPGLTLEMLPCECQGQLLWGSLLLSRVRTQMGEGGTHSVLGWTPRAPSPGVPWGVGQCPHQSVQCPHQRPRHCPLGREEMGKYPVPGTACQGAGWVCEPWRLPQILGRWNQDSPGAHLSQGIEEEPPVRDELQVGPGSISQGGGVWRG